MEYKFKESLNPQSLCNFKVPSNGKTSIAILKVTYLSSIFQIPQLFTILPNEAVSTPLAHSSLITLNDVNSFFPKDQSFHKNGHFPDTSPKLKLKAKPVPTKVRKPKRIPKVAKRKPRKNIKSTVNNNSPSNNSTSNNDIANKQDTVNADNLNVANEVTNVSDNNNNNSNNTDYNNIKNNNNSNTNNLKNNHSDNINNNNIDNINNYNINNNNKKDKCVDTLDISNSISTNCSSTHSLKYHLDEVESLMRLKLDNLLRQVSTDYSFVRNKINEKFNFVLNVCTRRHSLLISRYSNKLDSLRSSVPDLALPSLSHF